MTSRLLLFYSLFSEVNFNWQRKRTLWKSVLSQRELCKSMPSTLPNFNGVWLKLCHEQYFF